MPEAAINSRMCISVCEDERTWEKKREEFRDVQADGDATVVIDGLVGIFIFKSGAQVVSMSNRFLSLVPRF